MTAVEAPRRIAFAGPMGTSAARWGMELEPMNERQTDALMWVEVDMANVMRAIPERALERRIRRVLDIEMAAIKAAVESSTPDSAPQGSAPEGSAPEGSAPEGSAPEGSAPEGSAPQGSAP